VTRERSKRVGCRIVYLSGWTHFVQALRIFAIFDGRKSTGFRLGFETKPRAENIRSVMLVGKRQRW
jgi:hypothetical protein